MLLVVGQQHLVKACAPSVDGLCCMCHVLAWFPTAVVVINEQAITHAGKTRDVRHMNTVDALFGQSHIVPFSNTILV